VAAEVGKKASGMLPRSCGDHYSATIVLIEAIRLSNIKDGAEKRRTASKTVGFSYLTLKVLQSHIIALLERLVASREQRPFHYKKEPSF
jgi:hypothetical protein